MRHRKLLNVVLAVVTFGVAGFVSLGGGQTTPETKDPKHARPFMRQKLVYTQHILEGLALGNYNLIITNATLLSDMTQSNLWQIAYPDEYRTQSADFRKSALAIVTAAEEKKIEVARDAYGKTLQSCYDCHSHFLLDQMERHQNPKKGKAN